jgi:hypothetical protein
MTPSPEALLTLLLNLNLCVVKAPEFLNILNGTQYISKTTNESVLIFFKSENHKSK